MQSNYDIKNILNCSATVPSSRPKGRSCRLPSPSSRLPSPSSRLPSPSSRLSSPSSRLPSPSSRLSSPSSRLSSTSSRLSSTSSRALCAGSMDPADKPRDEESRMGKVVKNILLLLIVPIILTSCAQKFTPLQPKCHPQNTTPIRSNWIKTGKMAFNSEKSHWSANFFWHQYNNAEYEIRLSGPLNTHSILIKQDKYHFSFNDGNTIVTSRSAEELMQKELKLSIPITTLVSWLERRPSLAKTYKITLYNKNCSIQEFSELGYNIKYNDVNGTLRSIHIKTNNSTFKIIISG
jgi:outer membrane lipoprotein LolB